MTDNSDFLRVTDIGSYTSAKFGYGYSPKYLNRLRSTGDGPKFIKIGARVVYRRADIDEWVIGRSSPPVSKTAELPEFLR